MHRRSHPPQPWSPALGVERAVQRPYLPERVRNPVDRPAYATPLREVSRVQDYVLFEVLFEGTGQGEGIFGPARLPPHERDGEVVAPAAGGHRKLQRQGALLVGVDLSGAVVVEEDHRLLWLFARLEVGEELLGVRRNNNGAVRHPFRQRLAQHGIDIHARGGKLLGHRGAPRGQQGVEAVGVEVGDHEVRLVDLSTREDPALLHAVDRLPGPKLSPRRLGEPRQGEYQLVESALGHPRPLLGDHRGHGRVEGRGVPRSRPAVQGVHGDDLLESVGEPREAIEVALGRELGESCDPPQDGPYARVLPIRDEQERHVGLEICVHLDVAPPGRVPRVPLLDRQGANLALVMVGADFRQSQELEARYPGGPPYVFSAVPAPEVLLPDAQEGEKLGAGVDALAGKRHAAALAAEVGSCLQERHPHTGPREQARGGKAAQAAPDYYGRAHPRTLSLVWEVIARYTLSHAPVIPRHHVDRSQNATVGRLLRMPYSRTS